MSVFWIVLVSIVGVLVLIGIGIVIQDMLYYRQEERKKTVSTNTEVQKE